MLLLINPALRWVRTSKSAYALATGMRTYAVDGEFAQFLVEEFLPFFSEWRSATDVGAHFRHLLSEAELEQCVAGACAISALLTREVEVSSVNSALLHQIAAAEFRAPTPREPLTILYGGESRLLEYFRRAFDFEFEVIPLNDGVLSGSYAASAKSRAIVVAASSAPDAVDLVRLNRWALSRNIPFLPVRLGAFQASVGPLVIAFQTACFECAVLRHCAVSTESKLAVAMELDASLPRGPSNSRSVASNALASQVAGVVGAELLLFSLPPSSPGIIGRVVTLSHLSLGAQYHRVLRVPTCPACTWPGKSRHPWARIGATVEEITGHSRLKCQS